MYVTNGRQMKILPNSLNKANSRASLDSTKKIGQSLGSSVQVNKKDNSAAESSKIDLSDKARMMQKAKAIAANSTIDRAKVDRLQKLIDEGKYKFNAEGIADRLVDEHLVSKE